MSSLDKLPLHKDYREFANLLNAKKVEYLIVGGYAIGFHVKPRFTADIDIFVRQSSENAGKLICALHSFGFADLGITEEDILSTDMIQLGHAPIRIDLLTRITGVSFDEAWDDRVETDFDNTPLKFIGIECLIRNKLATGRDQDIADANALKQAREQAG